MMYDEFAKAVGCKDNAHNHKVFENLEVMYMNTDMSKEEIYEYGKKLVDNSKSPEQVALEKRIQKEIEEAKNDIEWYKGQIGVYKMMLDCTPCTPEEQNQYKRYIKEYKSYIKNCKSNIAMLKWVLE